MALTIVRLASASKCGFIRCTQCNAVLAFWSIAISLRVCKRCCAGSGFVLPFN